LRAYSFFERCYLYSCVGVWYPWAGLSVLPPDCVCMHTNQLTGVGQMLVSVAFPRTVFSILVIVFFFFFSFSAFLAPQACRYIGQLVVWRIHCARHVMPEMVILQPRSRRRGITGQHLQVLCFIWQFIFLDS
jgi:hypothetical protein